MRRNSGLPRLLNGDMTVFRSRRALLGAVLATALLACAGPAAADLTVTSARTATAKVMACQSSDLAQDRTAVFRGRMRRRAQAQRMAMRFAVQERVGDGSWKKISAPGLGRWRKSRRGVRAFGYSQRLRNLLRGADYRARVDFRWYDADGDVVKRARRRSAACEQDGPLPNLKIQRVVERPTSVAGSSQYTVRVQNAGGATVPEALVRFSANGDAPVDKTGGPVNPGAVALVRFTLPTCRSGVEVWVDPTDAVPERTERDNHTTLACGALKP